MLDVLRRVTQEVNAAKDLNSALNIIVERVRTAMNTDVCSVYLLDEANDEYVFMATRGLNADAIGKVRLNRSEGLVGYVGERAEPINLEDAHSHPRNRYVQLIGEDNFHAFLGVPIIHSRQVLGVLVVQQQQTRRYDESEEAFLITLSALLAGVIANAKATGALSLSSSKKKTAIVFQGMSGAPGVAIGTAVTLFTRAQLDNVPVRRTRNIDKEIRLFEQAVEITRAEIRKTSRKLEDQLGPEELALFEAYLHILDDAAISGEVIVRIKQGEWAQSALSKVILEHVANFEAMESEYLRERGADVRDLGTRVLASLQSSDTRKPRYPKATILVGEELAPADLAVVPRDRLVGFVSIKGSGNSHVAILAEAMGVPTVMGVEKLPDKLVDGKPMIIDGFQGSVITHPSAEHITYYNKVAEEEKLLVAGLEEIKDKRCVTPDGHRVRLWVNTGLIADVARSLDRGAEGVGLYRTEVHFMLSEAFPTEEEQRIIYREHLLAFAPKMVTMRTLDIGGDKSLPYFPIEEENPFLGWRGIRVTLDHPEIFIAQIRAMIRANEGINAHLRIMLPMISCLSEVDEAKQLVERCHRELVEEGVKVKMPDVGVMIEVPAAVYQAREIARRVDFLSVGSNDLIQYMLAVDRNNSQVASLYQEFHPAVLQALQQIVDAAHAEKKPLGICGEMAGNPSAALLLMAMGYDVLSMNSPNLLLVKRALITIKLSEAKKILKNVFKMNDANTIKEYVDGELRKAGLGQIVRFKRY
ncbi:MAG: phosphoenolpyruvate--protein phosphotransferase [Pseudomonadales bacterium]|jgi:phosphotransferase system enzyme I (PtsP)